MTTQFPRLLVGLLTLGGLLLPVGAVHGAPPIKVNLVFEKNIYSLQGTPDPEAIRFAVTMENTGSGEILASDGFQHEPLHLLVTFVRPDGKGITAPKLDQVEIEGEPPRILPVEGQYVQVDPLAHLALGDIASVDVPDAHSFYPLTQCGRYTAKVAVPIRTYPTVSRTFGGVDYADLDSADFAGVLQSDPVALTLTNDEDGDGSLCPEDCDDANSAVHPGATEIADNGVDDDCNPATLDVVPVTPATVLLTAKKKKAPVDDVVVRLFASGKDSCVTQFKGKKKVKSIWLSCTSLFDGLTGATGPGALSLAIPPGSYLLIAEYDPDAMPSNGDEVLIAASLGKLKPGKTKKGTISIKEKKPRRGADTDDDIAPDLPETDE